MNDNKLGNKNLNAFRSTKFSNASESRLFGPSVANVDEELDQFVRQIEENTFNILSIKQKFKVMKSNGQYFEEESSEKMDTFENQIDELEKRITTSFDSFNQRLNYMELLAFHPHMYHPNKIIKISDNHQITSAFYSGDYVYIGTDTSRVIIYSSISLKFENEIGPLDGTSVTGIGIIYSSDTKYIVAKAASKTVNIIDYAKPAAKKTFNSEIYCVYPTHHASPYRLAIYNEACKTISLFKDDLSTTEIKVPATALFSAPERLIVCQDQTLLIFGVEPEIQLEAQIQFDFTISKFTASRNFFVCANATNEIAVCDNDGNITYETVEGNTKFLFSWGSYFFRVGDDTLIQCRDFELKKEPSTIGHTAWWPHSTQSNLAACNISESTLITALDLTCVLWN